MTARTDYLKQASAYRKYPRRVHAIGMAAECASGSLYLSEKVAAGNAIAQLERVPRPAGFDSAERVMLTNPPLPVGFYTLRNARKRVMQVKATIAYIETREDFRGIGLEDEKLRLAGARRSHVACAKEFGKPVPLPGRTRLDRQATADLITAQRSIDEILSPMRSLLRAA